jgi:hypothetical protein
MSHDDMANGEDENRLSAFVSAYLAHKEGLGPKPGVEDLPPELRQEASDILRIVDATWGTAANIPALEDDPVAQALGFVRRPASSQQVQEIPVSGSKVVQARKRLGLKLSDVAAALNAKGIATQGNWLFKLEGAIAMSLPVGTADALARVLRTDITSLATQDTDEVGQFAVWLYSADFEAEVGVWAEEQARDPRPLVEAARGRLLTAVKRSSGEGARQQWVAMLRAVLEELA